MGALGAGETGAILSDGKGTLSFDVDKKQQQITYSLTYSGLSAVATQAHIHLGKLHVAGGIMFGFASRPPTRARLRQPQPDHRVAGR